MFSWLTNRGRLTALEGKFLDMVAADLSDEAEARMRSQMMQVHFVQRIGQGKEVNLYARKRHWEDRSLFSVRDEIVLARGTMYSEELKVAVDVELVSVNGHIFSLLYSVEPDPILGSVPVTIEQIRILVDPMAASAK